MSRGQANRTICVLRTRPRSTSYVEKRSSEPMKPTPNSNSEPGSLLVFGAHPDDIEFGCGAIVALETRAGRRVHLVVCSKGEAGTHGSPEQRVAEAQAAAKRLGASLEFVEFEGDAHLELRAAHAITLAQVV